MSVLYEPGITYSWPAFTCSYDRGRRFGSSFISKKSSDGKWIDVPDDFSGSLASWLASSVAEQKDATNKLENLSWILDVLIKSTQNDNDKMFALLKRVTELRDTANLSEVLDQRTLNTITQQNSFSVNNWVDAASMEAYLRRSLKI